MEFKPFKEFFGKIRRMKNSEKIVAAILIVLIALLVIPSGIGSGQKTQEMPEIECDLAAEELENRLEAILSTISGAGKVEVMITYASGIEQVLAQNQEQSDSLQQQMVTDGVGQLQQNTTSQSSVVTVTRQGSSEPVVLCERMPKIKGVVVVAQGAGEIAVKMNLIQAVRTALDITANKVDVFQMNEESN